MFACDLPLIEAFSWDKYRDIRPKIFHREEHEEHEESHSMNAGGSSH